MDGTQHQLERQQTAGGHVADRTQPALPVVHRKLANPAPLGLLSFATGERCDERFRE
jgi:succinate-acetate transporter protein